MPTLASNYKIRMVNGVTGTPPAPLTTQPPLTMDVNFAVVASNVAAGTSSTYSVLTQSATTQLDVYSPLSASPIYTSSNSTTALVIPGGTVFTLFMLGDANAPPSVGNPLGGPIHLLRKDR